MTGNLTENTRSTNVLFRILLIGEPMDTDIIILTISILFGMDMVRRRYYL